MASTSNNNDNDDEWERPATPFHAHFDCFSGAAGDMMLAACLDAAGVDDRSKSNNLLRYITRRIEQGMPELKGEFSLTTRQVWRGMGSIAALHVEVHSIYNHEAAPVPKSRSSEKSVSDKSLVHDHHHDHHDANHHDHQQHSHSHSENTASDPEHSHEHSHDHSHKNSCDHGQQSASDANSKTQTLPHSHSHNHNHNHSHIHSHHHDHQSSTSTRGPLRNLPQIRKMLQDAPIEFIPIWVKEHAIQAFTELAHAEALTHGAAGINDVHFHEVGAVDSIVDTVGTLLALYALHVTTVSCSRLPLGEGTVWTDHGLLPVPAPATLRLLVGMPTCPGPSSGVITGELVTPTAAALLRVLVLTRSSAPTSSSRSTFAGADNHHDATNSNTTTTAPSSPIMDGRPPAFTIRRIGIGAGTKDFEKHPNILRLMLGDELVGSNRRIE